MKKQLIILTAAVVVLVCTTTAIVASADRDNVAQAAQTSEVQKARAAQKKAEDTLRSHDNVNAANIKNAGDEILELKTKTATLCAQIKTAKLVQPLCQ